MDAYEYLKYKGKSREAEMLFSRANAVIESCGSTENLLIAAKYSGLACKKIYKATKVYEVQKEYYDKVIALLGKKLHGLLNDQAK